MWQYSPSFHWSSNVKTWNDVVCLLATIIESFCCTRQIELMLESWSVLYTWKMEKRKKNGECTMTKDILYVLAQCKNKSSYAVSAADKLLCLYCSFSAVSTAAGFRWSCCILPWVTCWKGSETCFLTHWGHGDQSPGRETCYNLAFGCICSLSLGIGFILFATCSRHSWFHHSSKWVIGHWRAVYWEEWEKVKDRQGHIKAVLVQVL